MNKEPNLAGTTDYERTYVDPYRFRHPYDLWTRYTEYKARAEEKKKEDEKIVHAYKRHPRKVRRGGKIVEDPNWGGYKAACDNLIKTLTSIAIDRKVWCRVETYEGFDKDMDDLWSDYITEAFHKYCIKPWHNKEQDTIKSVTDAVLFNRGIMRWTNPLCVYPEYIPQERVIPDTNATLDETSFDILFIRDTMSAVELYNMVADEDAEELGWHTRAVLYALRTNLSSLKGCDDKGVLARWRDGGVSQAECDQQIAVVIAYVKEYEAATEVNANKDKEGNQISLCVFPENLDMMGIKQDEPSTHGKDRSCTFQFVDYIYKCFTQAVSVRSASIAQGFYDSQSLGREIYTAFKFYDQSLNSIIRSVKRAMRLYIKTSSNDTKKRLRESSPDDEVIHLAMDDEISQFRMAADINGAMEIMRTVIGNVSTQNDLSYQGTSTSPKGYPITKGEAQILAQQLDDSNKVVIKMFISKDRNLINEVYRRFVTQEESKDRSYDNLKRFKKYLEKKGVPDEAWKFENVEVYPRFNQFAGSASQNYTTSQALMQATLIKPASTGEERAKRDVISSLVGEANVADYMDRKMQFDQELMIIGQENESLDNPYVNPTNVPVTESDNHILHYQGHLADYMFKMQFVQQLLGQAQQDQSYNKMFSIERAVDIINAQDNKGAHIDAHRQILLRDTTKEAELKELDAKFNQARSVQDQLVQQANAMKQELTQQGQQNNLRDLEFEHRQRMDDLELQKAQAMANIGAEKAASASEAKQRNSIRNQEIKEQGKLRDQEQKAADKRIDLEAKAQSAQIDLDKKRNDLQIDRAKAAKKAPTKKPTNNA